MKKTFTLLCTCLAVAAWTGCTKEMTTDPVGQGGRLTFQANTPTSEGSRAGYDGVHAIWHAGDEVVLATQRWGISMLCTQVEGSLSEDGRNVVYTTQLDETLHDGDIATVAYPASAVYYMNSHLIQMNFAATQHYVESGYTGVPLLSQAEVSGGKLSFEFKNSFAMIELSLAKDASLNQSVKVKSIEFQGANNEPVAGGVIVELENFPTITTRFLDDALSLLTLDCGAGVELTTEPTTFHIAIPVQEYAKGYRFNVITDAGVVSLSAKKNGVTPVANTIYETPLRTVAASDLKQIIPNAQFRQYLLGKGWITVLDEAIGEVEITEEGKAVTSIDCSRIGINSLVGIEYFTALESLNCLANQLTTLDVSQNTVLTNLDCSYNQLATLEFSTNTALESLNCSYNKLTTLELSTNTALEWLNCNYNQLTTLDLSQNTALEWLNCSENQLTTLDVSKNTALTGLSCSENQLTTLDVNNHTALTELNCSYNKLTTLDVSTNTALEWLNCFQNQLTTLDLSQNTALASLHCFQNQLTTLDLSQNTALFTLGCSDNQLTTLDVSKNTALTSLNCSGNKLTTLELSTNIAITSLVCSGNKLTTLDLSTNTALEWLNCFHNQLTTLDLNKNTALTSLECSYNQLTTLELSKNIALTSLVCFQNPLTTLDVSKNTAVVHLNCSQNQLTTLDVSKNTAVVHLDCSENQLTALDASTMTNENGRFFLLCGAQNIGAGVHTQLTLREAQREHWMFISSDFKNVGVVVTFIL